MDSQTSHAETAGPPPLLGWRAMLRDLMQMIRFYSRLPTPKLPFEADKHAMPDFQTAPRMLPFAASLISLPAVLTLLAGAFAGLPPFVVAALTVTVAALTTGAMHEDGLTDAFDGLAGGRTPERRLEIMKDSRIGAFGGTALMMALILRVTLLAALVERLGADRTALFMLVVAALSRSIALLPLVVLPPARSDGFSALVGRPTSRTFVAAMVVSLLGLGGAAGFGEGLSLWPVALGVAVAVLFTLAMTWWALRLIHGQTGDIAGACQQLAEIGFYLGVMIGLGRG